MAARVNPWRDVLVTALAALVLCFVAIMAINEVIILPLVVFAVIFAALAFAVARWGRKRWLPLVAGVLALLALLGNLPFIADDLAHPETFFTFAPTAVSILAALLAAVAAAMTFRDALPRAAWAVAGAVATVAGLAVVVSFAATLAAGSDDAQANDVRIVAADVEFTGRVTAPAGAVGIFVENRDRFRHTFVIEDQDMKTELPGNRDRRVAVNLAAGTYRYYCDVPGHEDMEGTLEVS